MTVAETFKALVFAHTDFNLLLSGATRGQHVNRIEFSMPNIDAWKVRLEDRSGLFWTVADEGRSLVFADTLSDLTRKRDYFVEDVVSEADLGDFVFLVTNPQNGTRHVAAVYSKERKQNP